MDQSSYLKWREKKLKFYPRSVDELIVEINGLPSLTRSEKTRIISNCRRANMAIYRCRNHHADRAAIRAFAANFGLKSLDHHLCANEDGVAVLSASVGGDKGAYSPYTSGRLNWHTDGYYNDERRRLRAVILHCMQNATRGGENALLDPEIAYIHLRDENPEFITALEHPRCMSIPANNGPDGEIRPAVSGPVFWRDAEQGALYMRFSERKKFISWREDSLTRAARDCLSDILGDKNGPVLRYRLGPGEGFISNNVLHNRSAFEEFPVGQRLLYRARYFDRIESS